MLDLGHFCIIFKLKRVLPEIMKRMCATRCDPRPKIIWTYNLTLSQDQGKPPTVSKYSSDGELHSWWVGVGDLTPGQYLYITTKNAMLFGGHICTK